MSQDLIAHMESLHKHYTAELCEWDAAGRMYSHETFEHRYQIVRTIEQIEESLSQTDKH